LRQIPFYGISHAVWHSAYALTTAYIAWSVAKAFFFSATVVGLVQSLVLAPAIISIFFMRMLFHAKPLGLVYNIVLAGLLAPAIVLLSFPKTVELYIIVFLAIAVGIAEPIYLMLREALISNLGERKHLAISSLPAFEATGRIVGYLLIPTVASTDQAFFSTKIIAGLFLMGFASLAVEFRQGSTAHAIQIPRGSGEAIHPKVPRRTRKLIYGIGIFQLINGFVGVGAYTVVFPLIVRDIETGNAGSFSAVLMANYLSMIAISICVRRVSQVHQVVEPVIYISLVVQIFALVALFQTPTLHIALISSTLWGASAAFAQIGGRHLIHSLSSENLPNSSALFHSVFLGSSAVGAMSAGVLLDYIGFIYYLITTTCICAVGLCGVSAQLRATRSN